MHLIDWILIGIIAIAAVTALLSIRTMQKRGSCCGNCAACKRGCRR